MRYAKNWQIQRLQIISLLNVKCTHNYKIKYNIHFDAISEKIIFDPTERIFF